MDRRRLPIGIQTFRQIREEDHCYVDRTGYARLLADDAGKHCFLSRPRRFGKSLFVDTLKELSPSRCSGVSPSTIDGTGRSATPWCVWTSATATSRTPMGLAPLDVHGRSAASACAPARMLYRP